MDQAGFAEVVPRENICDNVLEALAGRGIFMRGAREQISLVMERREA